eukprot:2846047-Prymnesium_polylepis.1
MRAANRHTDEKRKSRTRQYSTIACWHTFGSRPSRTGILLGGRAALGRRARGRHKLFAATHLEPAKVHRDGDVAQCHRLVMPLYRQLSADRPARAPCLVAPAAVEVV